jgi:hypothetical protein
MMEYPVDRMTFALIRFGLPNSVAILALAMVPLVSLAMAALPEHADVAHYRSPAVMQIAGIDAADRADVTAE